MQKLCSFSLVLIFLLGLTNNVSANTTMSVSWYGPGLQGNRMANGNVFNMHKLTVAHRSLPFGTIIKLIDPDDRDNYVIAEVTDRGPFVKNRQLDVTKEVARRLGFIEDGVKELIIRIVSR